LDLGTILEASAEALMKVAGGLDQHRLAGAGEPAGRKVAGPRADLEHAAREGRRGAVPDPGVGARQIGERLEGAPLGARRGQGGRLSLATIRPNSPSSGPAPMRSPTGASRRTAPWTSSSVPAAACETTAMALSRASR